jgi:DNA-3-methyladenine glycosylase II
VRVAAAALGERWRPWRTVATWYLWRSLEAVPVEY